MIDETLTEFESIEKRGNVNGYVINPLETVNFVDVLEKLG